MPLPALHLCILRRGIPVMARQPPISAPIQRFSVMFNLVVDAHLRPCSRRAEANVDVIELTIEDVYLQVPFLKRLVISDGLIAT